MKVYKNENKIFTLITSLRKQKKKKKEFPLELCIVYVLTVPSITVEESAKVPRVEKSRESVGKFARILKRPLELMRNFVGGVDAERKERNGEREEPWGRGRERKGRWGAEEGGSDGVLCRLSRTKVKERAEAPGGT